MADNFLNIRKGLNLPPTSVDPTNPIDGDLQFADGTVRPIGLWEYRNGAWAQSGGGGGGLDVFLAQDFEALSATDFTSGLNATYKTAGTFGGILANETTVPISGDQSPQYTAGVTSTNDWFDVETITLDLKQRGEAIGIEFYANSSNFAVDVEFVVWDNTNAVKLDTTGFNIVKANTGKSRYSFSLSIPQSTLSISYGFHLVNAPINGESFIFDDFQFSTNPFISKNLVDTQSLHMSDLLGFGSTATKIPYFSIASNDNGSGVFSYTNDSTNGLVITMLKDCVINASLSLFASTAAQLGISVNASSVTTNVYNIADSERFAYSQNTASLADNVAGSMKLKAGDIIRPHTTGVSNDIGSGLFTISAIAESEHLVTPAKSSNEFFTIPQKTGFWNATTDTSQFDHPSFNPDPISGVTFPNSKYLRIENVASVDRIVAKENILLWIAVNGTQDANTGILIYNSSGVVLAGNAQSISAENVNVSIPIKLIKGDWVRIRNINPNVSRTGALQLTAVPDGAVFNIALPIQKIAFIKDLKPSFTNGGASFANTVTTRDLNTLEGDFAEIGITLAANQFGLPPGKYLIEIQVPGYRTNGHQVFLHDGSTYVADGSNAYSDGSTDNVQSLSHLKTLLTVNTLTTFEVRHWTSNAQGSNGLGSLNDNNPSNPQTNEVYTVVKITKLR